MKATDRATKIRYYTKEINNLKEDKKRLGVQTRIIGDQISKLYARIKEDLDYERGDFNISMQLHNLAVRKQKKTLDTVREIMLALGDIIPKIEVVKQPEISTDQITGKDLIVQVLQKYGPQTASEIKQHLPSIASSVSSHLSRLNQLNRVRHNGQIWELTKQQQLRIE